MCIAGAEDTDAMSERSLSLYQGGAFLNTDFHGVLFTEQRQIQETLFLFFVHILDQHGVIAVVLIVGCAACTGPQPFAVFLYVKVISSRCERTAVDAIACVTEFCFMCTATYLWRGRQRPYHRCFQPAHQTNRRIRLFRRAQERCRKTAFHFKSFHDTFPYKRNRGNHQTVSCRQHGKFTRSSKEIFHRLHTAIRK